MTLAGAKSDLKPWLTAFSLREIALWKGGNMQVGVKGFLEGGLFNLGIGT